jgi:hypothetical protein
MSPSGSRSLLLLVIATAGPLMLGMDLVARKLVLDGQPDDVREVVSDFATKVAWACAPGPLVGGLVGFFVYRALRRRGLAKVAPGDEKGRMSAEMSALIFGCTPAQIPALVGDISVIMGARLAPAIVMTTTSVACVLLIAWLGPRSSASR